MIKLRTTGPSRTLASHFCLVGNCAGQLDDVVRPLQVPAAWEERQLQVRVLRFGVWSDTTRASHSALKPALCFAGYQTSGSQSALLQIKAIEQLKPVQMLLDLYTIRHASMYHHAN